MITIGPAESLLRLEWSAEENHGTNFFKALVNNSSCLQENRAGNEQRKNSAYLSVSM